MLFWVPYVAGILAASWVIGHMLNNSSLSDSLPASPQTWPLSRIIATLVLVACVVHEVTWALSDETTDRLAWLGLAFSGGFLIAAFLGLIWWVVLLYRRRLADENGFSSR